MLQMQWGSRFRGRRFEVFCLDLECSHKHLECRFRWPCRATGSFSRLQICEKSVEIILALQSRASFPRVVRACQILISWQAQHCERFACRCNVIFRYRRSSLELFVQISWQAQHFRAFRAVFVAGAVLSSLHADVVAGAALWAGRVALAAARCTV